jgi:hypothetical protein
MKKTTSIGLLALAGFALSTPAVSAVSPSQDTLDATHAMVRVSGSYPGDMSPGLPPGGPTHALHNPLRMSAYGDDYGHEQGHGHGKGHGKGKGRGHGRG